MNVQRLLVLSLAMGAASATVLGGTDEELLSVYVSAAGPAPRISGLTVHTTGEVWYGEIGAGTECGVLSSSELEELETTLAGSTETFVSAAAADYRRTFSDVREVSFVLRSPVYGAEREIMIPLILFPVGLEGLARLVDEAGLSLCGERYESILNAVEADVRASERPGA